MKIRCRESVGVAKRFRAALVRRRPATTVGKEWSKARLSEAAAFRPERGESGWNTVAMAIMSFVFGNDSQNGAYVHYVTRLCNAEVNRVARKEYKTLDDLRGKTVNS